MINDIRIAVIVLNYKGFQDTINSVKSIIKSNFYKLDVIIVDNFSQDDSVREIVKAFKLRIDNKSEDPLETYHNDDIKLILSKKNLGYAGGNNLGINHAMKRGKYDYFWILNNDTWVNKDTLNNLVVFAEKNVKVGIVGSKIFDYDPPHGLQSFGAYFKPLTGDSVDLTTLYSKEDLENGLVKLDKIKFTENFSVSGASFFLKKEMLQEIGLLNEIYFLYFEEFDYSLRAFKAGWQTRICIDAKVYHKIGASTKKNLRTPFYYSFRARLLFMWKYYKQFFLFVAFYQTFRITIPALFKLKFNLIKWTAEAWLDFFKIVLKN